MRSTRPLPPGCAARAALSAAAFTLADTGRLTVIVVPVPTLDCTSMRPPWFRTIE